MRKVIILYRNFYTPDGNEMSVGGIQTYIKMLIEVIKENNMIPVIYQYSDVDFRNQYNDVTVYGVRMEKRWSDKRKRKVLYRKCMENYNSKNDIILFACETMVVKNNEDRVIAIQHGVSWDIKGHEDLSHQKNLLFIFLKAIRAFKLVNRIYSVKTLVGVDYNFLNWYRTQVAYIEVDVKVIPNCVDIKKVNKPQNDMIEVIFARRFNVRRGTRLFAHVVKDFLKKYDNVRFTFAGSGPDEELLKEFFKGNKKVRFIKYDSEKSLEIHEKYDIAVIPTIGSEGTSFSLLEAMASKCSVIASNVGGMTNIILDNYNGLMISPNQEQLFEALERLVNDSDLRETISENAYYTVSRAFNKNIWKEKWTKVFNSFDM